MPFLKSAKVSIATSRSENCKKNGLRHAIFEATCKPSKGYYKGEWRNDKKEGKGTKLNKNNWLYEGDWQNGSKQGYGILSKVSKDGTIWKCYAGNWVKGKKQGFGGHWYLDGSYFEGTFRQNDRDGFGRMWYNDGSFYQGTWKNDLYHGEGMLVQGNGNRYEGQFSRGKKEGYGTYYHLDSGQLQDGCWKWDICVTSTMEDIDWRQSALRPTCYSIPCNELANWDNVVANGREEALRLHK